METKQCSECLKDFEPKRPTKKYCSDACKQAAYLKRQQGTKAPAAQSPLAELPIVNPTLKDYLLQDISAKLSQLMSLEGPHKTTLELAGGGKQHIIILCASTA